VRWQKIARLLIASFVIVFAGVVVFYLKQGTTAAKPEHEAVKVTDGSRTESGKGTITSIRTPRLARRSRVCPG